MKQITNHKLCQFIVKKYVQINTNWPKEIKIAQNLIKKYKNYSFWNNLNQIKIPSLAWFLTEEGKKFINIQLKIQNLIEIKKNSYNISQEKIGIDKKTCQKPKTIIQFIRSWEENQKKK
jgi:hypothetical protein